jgi:predicted GIY-YIG superfamily endonuclease
MKQLIRHILREHTREIGEGGTGVKQTKQEFIDKANKVHRNKFDYSKVDYINSGTKVEIMCPEHGSFFQSPRNHIAGQGCRQCGLESNRQKFTKNSDKFKEQANLIHNNKYDYSKVNYVNNNTPVEIICPKHGSFFQAPGSHLSGRRCPDCARISGAEKHTKWTKEEVYKEASKYETLTDFQKQAIGAYVSATKNGWMDDLKKNFKILKKNWTKEEIQEIANNYLARGKFCLENSAACSVARRKGWYEDVVKHMEPVGNKYNRAIYVFEFPDHSAYVGLTGNLKRREKSHMEEEDNSAVLLHMNRIGQKPLMKILSDGYIDFKDAQNMESCMLDKYRSEGWKILNRAKTGSLGSCTRVWTLEMLKKLVKKYKSRTEFVTKEPNAYAAAARNGWLDDVFTDMKRLINPNNTWTYEVVAKEAAKYNKKTDFAKGSPLAYNAARRNGWFEELTKNYSGGITKWTYDLLKKEAKKYKTRKEFATNSASAYNASIRQNVLDDFFPIDKRYKRIK